MDFYFFDKNENLKFIRNDALDAVSKEDEYTLSLTFPQTEKKVERGQLVGFYDVDNVFTLFEIRVATETLPENEVEILAYHAAVAELIDEMIETISVSDKQAAQAVNDVIARTRWTIGTAVESSAATGYFYYDNVWNALKTIMDTWGVKLRFRWNISDSGIESRNIDVLNRLGADRGKRLEISKDIKSISVEYDERDIVTALYGRGKGEEVGENQDGDPTYGRKINFGSVVWETPNDPLNKPEGQQYIEDPAATALYGRCGRPKFGQEEFPDCEDPLELIQLTYDELQKVNKPKISITAEIIDLEALWGYSHEAIRLGDDVLVIVDELSVEVKAEVVSVNRDLLAPENTQVTIGNYKMDAVDMQVQTQSTLEKTLSISRVAAAAVAAAPSLIQGYIDTVITQIRSSGTNLYTDTDGAFIFETDDGTKAVKIAGAGILLANTKIGGVWQWRTAINGQGIAADEIYTGTLRSAIIFAGTLQAVLGSFADLKAGDDTAAHMRMGADEYAEPYLKVLGSDGITEQLKITKKGVTYTGFGRQAKYSVGDRYGIGVYID